MRLAVLTEKAACGVPEMPSNEIQQALVSSSIHHEPYRLLAFRGIAFLGCKPGEKGFIVGTKAGNIPPCVAEKHFLRHPDQIVAMRPFMGGQELNNNEHATPSRHAIFLDEHTSSIFKETSDLLKSFLTTSKRSSRHWCRYSAPANELMSRLATMENIIAWRRRVMRLYSSMFHPKPFF